MYTLTGIFIFNSIVVFACFKPSPAGEGIIIEIEESRTLEMNSINTEEDFAPATIEKEPEDSITFKEAFCIPGVMLYGFAFFCVKFAVYAFLLWLPLFLS